MHLRYRLVPAFTLAALLAASVAFAAKPAPVIESITGDPIESIDLGLPHPNAACNLGVTAAPASIINYLLPPDDAYYTLLNPTACSCAGNSVQLNVASFFLNFQVACTQPVRVRIVPAIDLGGGCYEPDIATTLCGPLTYNLAPGTAGNFQFGLPLPTGCCIDGPVFLDINFINPGAGCSTSGTRPRLITTGTCEPCVSWNVYPGGFDDLCLDAGFPGNPAMWVQGDCCQIVPTLPGSWGRVKTLYR